VSAMFANTNTDLETPALLPKTVPMASLVIKLAKAWQTDSSANQIHVLSDIIADPMLDQMELMFAQPTLDFIKIERIPTRVIQELFVTLEFVLLSTLLRLVAIVQISQDHVMHVKVDFIATEQTVLNPQLLPPLANKTQIAPLANQMERHLSAFALK